MDNVEIDSAIILENEVRRRVREVVNEVVEAAVKQALMKELVKAKEHMMTEISITIGRTIRAAADEGRKPLWEYTPEEMGMTPEEVKDMQSKHMISGGENYALRKQAKAV